MPKELKPSPKYQILLESALQQQQQKAWRAKTRDESQIVELYVQFLRGALKFVPHNTNTNEAPGLSFRLQKLNTYQAQWQWTGSKRIIW